MSQGFRPKLPRQIEAGIIKSKLDAEYESKVQTLEKMGGLLIINGQKYTPNINDFEYLGRIGSGTCGHVTKMKHEPSGVVMAVKRKRRCNTCDVHQYQYKKMVIDLPIDLKTNDCPHIVQCYGFFFDGDLWVFMELMETSMDQLSKVNKQIFPEYIVGKVTVAVVEALIYLKEKHGIQHKNIKPSNIFLDKLGEVKLSDFRIPDSYINMINPNEYTLYAAPERILLPNFPECENYEIENVWSLGIVLIELTTGVFPYRVCNTIFQAMEEILKGKPLISDLAARFSPELKDFIDYCLVNNYQQRPEYDQLMKHPFFQKHKKFNYKTLNILAFNGLTKLYDNWSQASVMDILMFARKQLYSSHEYAAKLKDILIMNGILNIHGQSYNTTVNDLEKLEKLGDETSGYVVKMRHKPSGINIAVKHLRYRSDEIEKMLDDLILIQNSRDCPYLVNYYGCLITDSEVWICMELMATCLKQVLKVEKRLITEDFLGRVTVTVIKALLFLKKKHGIIHRNVRPSNILLDSVGGIRLCGCWSRSVPRTRRGEKIEGHKYLAPEVIDPNETTKPNSHIKADFWSLGITVIELVTGENPYGNYKTEFELLSRIVEKDPPVLPSDAPFSSEIKNFVASCLIKNYKERPSYDELMKHPFFLKYECFDKNVISLRYLSGLVKLCGC